MSSPQNEYQYDVFISHARDDSNWCEKLANRLTQKGLRVWLDAWCVKPGMRRTEVINQGLQKSRRFIPVMTKVYFKEEWAKRELESAINKEADNPVDQFIIPVILEECERDIPPLLKNFVRIDFRNDNEFEKNCEALIKILLEAKVTSQAAQTPSKPEKPKDKDDEKKPADPTPTYKQPPPQPESEAPPNLLNVAPPIIINEKKPSTLSKGEKWQIVLGIIGIIVTIFLSDKLLVKVPPVKVTPKFLTGQKIFTLRDTIRIEQTQGEIREVPLDVRFDGFIFEGAAKFITRRPRPRWSFNTKELKEVAKFPAFSREDKHKMEVCYPGQAWSETFVLIFDSSKLDTSQERPPPEAPQFEISDTRHPDSTFVIRPANVSAQRLNSPLRAKFDSIEIETPLVQELDRNGRMLWKFNLGDANSKLKPELQKNGIHALQLKFRDSEWSTSYRVRFDPVPPPTYTETPLPPLQIVYVNIESVSNDLELRLRYGKQAGHILSYINGRTMSEIVREPHLKNDITIEGWRALEKLLQLDRINVVTENGDKSILAVISQWAGGYEVRPILVHLTTQTNGKPLWLILVFDNERPPHLVNVECDVLGYWLHFTQYENPMTTEDPEYEPLSNFVSHLEECYDARKLDCLRAAFVDTAKILVGIKTSDGVQYQSRTKEVYLDKLRKIFESSTHFNVDILGFVFKKMPGMRSCYFVQMRQRYENDDYKDEGIVSMIVEYDAQKEIVIIRRSWQPLDRKSDLSQSGH